MIALTYFSPEGDFIANPPLELLHSLLFEEPPEYWCQGSGMSDLCFIDHTETAYVAINDRPSLSFFAVEPYGVLLSYQAPRQSSQVPCIGLAGKPWVMHYVGGEPMYVPLACFVSRPVAWEAVQEFVRSQRKPEALDWVSYVSLELPDGNGQLPDPQDLA
jgi:hypothetical protein